MTAGAVPFGDRSVLVTVPDVAAAHRLAARIAGPRAPGTIPGGLEEVVVGHASVLVVLTADPDVADLDAWTGWLADSDGASGDGDPGPVPSTVHRLPVVFDGEDLDEVAAAVGSGRDDVVDLLVGADLTVAFVGFAPGFPYLTGLAGALAALPRRPTPRTRVPAGSVAVAGGFAAVYPRATPGGWNLLGRTPAQLFDADVPPYSRVAPGDRVRFVVADPGAAPHPPHAPHAPHPPHAPHAPHAPPAEGSRPLLTAGGDALEVLDPGIATTVQDLGRTGVSGLGVPTAGAADRRAHTLANLLVGNDPGAASVECTAVGPVVRMVGAGHVAVVGCGPDSVEVTLDGRPVPDGVVLPVADGQVVRIGRITRGLRAYLAVAGGFDTPVVLGSRSSDVLAGLGHGPLHAGDRLARDAPARVRGRLTLPPVPSGPVVLRVVAGPHAGPGDDGEDHLRRLIAHRWRVGSAVDRVGVRLLAVGSPAPLPPVAPAGSVPMVTGAVQLPPDGDPIVLLPDHATVGGYPVVACVVSADLPRLGQLAPDARVAFTLVDTAEAVAALAASRDEPASLVSGWFPTGAGT